jgi:hypothetical protein
MECVRVFSQGAKPSSLLRVKGIGEETETETETDSGAAGGWNGGYPMGSFPFPRVGSPVSFLDSDPSTSASTTTAIEPSSSSSITSTTHKFDLDMTDYPLPDPHPSPALNVFIESIKFDSVPHAGVASLNGTVIVRNVGYEKNVWVRFTLDEWNTTSEVVCNYVASLEAIPPQFLPRTLGDIISSSAAAASSMAVAEESLHIRSRTEGPAQVSHGWDRFSFSIRLEDYMSNLHERTIWMVGRFLAPGRGEWWDNNGERNYRVKFRKVPLTPEERQQRSLPGGYLLFCFCSYFFLTKFSLFFSSSIC